MGLVIALSAALSADAPVYNYTPIDLRAVVNADPLARASLFIPSTMPYIPETRWFEAESVYKKTPELTVQPQARASGGSVLGGGWGTRGGDWAEWNFDLPWGSDDMQLYLRVIRTGGNPVASMTITWDGRELWGAQVPVSSSPDPDLSFESGLCRLELKRQQMGRHVLRIKTTEPGDLIALDGFWLADGQVDVVNRIDAAGKIMAVASRENLLFPPGERTLKGTEAFRDITISMIDPETNNRNAFFLSGDVPFQLAFRGEKGSALVLLAAGLKMKGEKVDDTTLAAKAEITYEDGAMESAELAFEPLFTSKRANDPVVSFGMSRYGYLVGVPLNVEKALKSVRVISDEGKIVVVAASLQAPAN